MKKRIVKLLLVTSFLTLITGCSNKNNLQSEYDKACVERDALQAENNQLIENTKKVHSQIEGTFVATVRALIPNYTLDDKTRTVAILTCFQDSPFTISVGEENAGQLIEGETYLFHIKTTDIGEISKEEFDAGVFSVQAAISLYNIQISGFRIAADSEIGLFSVNLTYEKIDK
jgi:hypothetical protein